MHQSKPGRRYHKIKKIGEGTYGTVTKVFDNKLKIFNAVKKIKFYAQEQTIPISALRQITSLKQLNHPHILKQAVENDRLYNVTYQPQKHKLYINLQYLEQNLYDHIKRNGTLSPYTIKAYTFQMLEALKYMQSRSYMHRDLKPQNIMISKNGQIKLIDFGQIKKFNIGNFQQERHTMEISTLWYKAPQLLLGYQYYCNKIDVWAVGCILAEMVTGEPLFEGKSQIEQIFKIFEGLGTPKMQQNPQMKKWEYISPTLPKFEKKTIHIPFLGQTGNDLLNKMLQINPKKRISVNQALKHMYFEGIN